MRSRSLRPLFACFALALCLSLLPGRAGAVGLLDIARTPAPAATEQPEGSVWTTLWNFVADLLSIQPPPPPPPPPPDWSTDASNADQGVTLDPNG